jgi:hypothetical protein
VRAMVEMGMKKNDRRDKKTIDGCYHVIAGISE